MIRSYNIEKKVLISDCDMFGRMRPSGVLSMLQMASAEHAYAVGTPLVKPRGGTAMWVIARTFYKFDRPVRVNETISIHTAIRMPLGIVFYRDFEFYDSRGKQIGMGTSVWMLTDRNTKKNIGMGISAGLGMTKISSSLKSNRITRFRFPQTMTKTGNYRFTGSDLDMNGHANNARYGDILLDAFELEIFRQQYISELQINYKTECMRGETADIFTGRDINYRYVRGEVDEKVRFEARFKLQQC